MAKIQLHKRPNQMLFSILFSTLLFLTAAAVQSDTAIANRVREHSRELLKGRSRDQLPSQLENNIRRYAAQQTGISRRRLRITEFNRQIWPDLCLGLAQPGEICGEVLVEGWRIVVSDDSQNWVYRTDNSGSTFRQENAPLALNLPTSIAANVLQDATQKSGLGIESLRIVEARMQTWPDQCLGMSQECPDGSSEAAGWQIMIASPQNLWGYRTNADGAQIQLDFQGNIESREIPAPLLDGIRRDLFQQLGLARQELMIRQATRETWPNGCLGLDIPNIRCMQTPIEGWRIVVEDIDQNFIYRTDSSDRVYLENQISPFYLPQAVGDRVLQAIAGQSRVNLADLQIVAAQRQDWENSCLGVGKGSCQMEIVAGWQVTVEGAGQRWVYHTNASGSQLALNEALSSHGGDPENPGVSALPSNLANTVVQKASQMSGLPRESLQIVAATRSSVFYRPENCIGGAAPPPGMCDARELPGWQVTVENAYQQRWVYAIDDQGRVITAELGEFSGEFLPLPIQQAVREAWAQETGRSAREVNVVQARRGPWLDNCLGLGRTGEACQEQLIEGWRILINADDQHWVYRTNSNPEQILLRLEDSHTMTKILPNAIAQAILQQASQQSGRPHSNLRIIQAQEQTWPNGCLGLPNPGATCSQAQIRGWRVTVAAGEDQYWIYRVGSSADQVQLDQSASTAMQAWLLPIPLP